MHRKSRNHPVRMAAARRGRPMVGSAGRPIRALGRGIMGDRAGGAVTGKQRIAAVVALLSGAATLVLAVTVAIIRFPNGLGVLACVVVAVVASWFGVVRRGTRRVVGIAVAVLALLGAGALLFRNDGWLSLIGLAIGVAIWHAASQMAFRVHVRRPAAEPPRRAVLFIAGTRNHFALDLGVDRDDVVGALDAFVDGGEHLVDLGEVNGRVFVNNVSMGLYAEAVQSKGYRDSKIRTLLNTVPMVFGPSGSELDLQWASPDGATHPSAATILVSNNSYRLGHAVGSGTRPRIDAGRLGVAVVPASGGN